MLEMPRNPLFPRPFPEFVFTIKISKAVFCIQYILQNSTVSQFSSEKLSFMRFSLEKQAIS